MDINSPLYQAVVCEIVSGSKPPDEIMVSPWGSVDSKSGDYVMDETSARMIVEAFNGHGVDLPIDYEHQTLGGDYSSPSGRAPAAGWIKSLFARPGVGLFARVAWTVQGAADLARRAYRYLSPVLLIRRLDRRVIGLHSAALTNKPAIPQMVAVVNKDVIINQVGVLNMNIEELLTELRSILGLGADVDASAVLARVRELAVAATASANSNVDLSQVVGREDYESAVHRAESAEDKMVQMELAAFIDEGSKAGKITPFMRPRWEQMFLVNPDQARDWLKNAPQVAPASGRVVTAAVHKRSAHGSERQSVISRAVHEWEDEPVLQRLVDKTVHVNGELREAKQPLLTDSETAMFV